MVKRCEWSESEDMTKYHDTEWGVPVHNDKGLFEKVILEGAQAGLSWSTILKRRENYRKAFANFEVEKVSKFNEDDFDRLINDEGIIRNKLKIRSAISNAKAFIEIQEGFGSFDKYIWGFVNNKTIVNNVKEMKDIPVNTLVSDAMSKDLKKRGFNFVGSTICYAFMQAVGLVNDHQVSCFRFKEV
ncbi:MAG: DNA-3-methyladenine glycosylase I [Nanoarchaeota archaeon]|nr:DNA-3-methyladenine glycosylase I [Nanoarchaeota archaeon]|tara:strand:+ start:459 stop:1016 length:558 start_codon:yes stop_codon:yes gene_type:complete